jgi:hypothetical protein
MKLLIANILPGHQLALPRSRKPLLKEIYTLSKEQVVTSSTISQSSVNAKDVSQRLKDPKAHIKAVKEDIEAARVFLSPSPLPDDNGGARGRRRRKKYLSGSS